MSDPAATAQRQQQQQTGLLVGLLTLPLRILVVLCGSLMLSIFLECAGLYFLWPEEGWRHSQQMFEFELNQLSSDFKRSALVQEPGRTAQYIMQMSYDLILKKTGIEESIQGTSKRARSVTVSSVRDGRYLIAALYSHLESALIAAAYTTLVFIIRLLVLFLSLPLYVLAVFIGLVDGLVRRDLRRFGAGRESGYIYHRAKACVMPLMTWPWVIYLTLPMSLNAIFILLPSAVILGFILALATSSFKKYL